MKPFNLEKTRPRVQLDLPAPLLNAENEQTVYRISSEGLLIIGYQFKSDYELDLFLLEAGKLFASKEDAEEWREAMRNARRQGNQNEYNHEVHPNTTNDNGWISVKDRLPPSETYVLGLCQLENQDAESPLTLIVSLEIADGEYYFLSVNKNGLDDESAIEVTHWRPLPIPPTAQ